MPPELLARFLVQEGLLVRTVSRLEVIMLTISQMEKGQPVFSFDKNKVKRYDFNMVEFGLQKLNASLQQGLVPNTPTTLLLFKRVVAWARLNLDDLDDYEDSTKGELSKLFLKIGKVPVLVKPQLVIDELVDRQMLKVDKEKVVYDLHHLTGKPKSGEARKAGWLQSILYVLVIVLFWGSMLGQIIPQGTGGVGGLNKGRAKANTKTKP